MSKQALTFTLDPTDLPSEIAGTLCDLMHLAAANGLDPEALIEDARTLYGQEHVRCAHEGLPEPDVDFCDVCRPLSRGQS